MKLLRVLVLLTVLVGVTLSTALVASAGPVVRIWHAPSDVIDPGVL
jgi:hypothetical protein